MNEADGGVETNPIYGGDSVRTTTTRSRHSSLHGPYRDNAPEENNFPFCHRVFTAYGSAESYARSLLSLGHGYPIFDVVGDWNRSALHLKRGLSLGDIGLLNSDGDFLFIFNIFAPSNDPIHINETPPDFVPMKYPDPAEVTQVPNYFPPSTILASKGITIDRISDSPLEFNVTSSVREGGILVLPEGASREDFVPSLSLFEYIERNAIEWYSHIPHVLRGSLPCISNGSLYLVTGCDKTQSVICVGVPSMQERSGAEMNIRYKQDENSQWSDRNLIRICSYEPELNPGAQYGVFVRGIRISLNHRIWTRNPPYLPSPSRPYFNLLSTPITGGLSRIIRQYELRYGPRSTLCFGHPKIPFHVSDIIAQIILNEASDSEVAIIEDSVWMNHVDPASGDGTVSEIFKLVVRALLGHDIVPNKLVRLAPQTLASGGQTSKRRIFPGVFQNIYNRWQVERKVKKVVYERPPRKVKDVFRLPE